jgi:hypothetical protein
MLPAPTTAVARRGHVPTVVVVPPVPVIPVPLPVSFVSMVSPMSFVSMVSVVARGVAVVRVAIGLVSVHGHRRRTYHDHRRWRQPNRDPDADIPRLPRLGSQQEYHRHEHGDECEHSGSSHAHPPPTQGASPVGRSQLHLYAFDAAGPQAFKRNLASCRSSIGPPQARSPAVKRQASISVRTRTG